MVRYYRRKSLWEIIQSDFQSQFFIKVARAYPGELDGDLRHLVWSEAARLEEKKTGHRGIQLPPEEE